jgi:hypothetical protein
MGREKLICAIVMYINDGLPTLCEKFRFAAADLAACREQALIYLPNTNMG